MIVQDDDKMIDASLQEPLLLLKPEDEEEHQLVRAEIGNCIVRCESDSDNDGRNYHNSSSSSLLNDDGHDHDDDLEADNDSSDPHIEESEIATTNNDGIGHKPSTLISCAILVFVAFLYSTFSISLRGVYSMPDAPRPSEWTTIRGWVVLAFFLPFVIGNSHRHRGGRNDDSSTSSPIDVSPLTSATTISSSSSYFWMAAIELAMWNFLSQVTYNVGLLTTVSARAAFLSQSCVVMTPIFAMLVGDTVTKFVWLGCVSSYIGLGFLSFPDCGNCHDTDSNNDDDDEVNGNVTTTAASSSSSSLSISTVQHPQQQHGGLSTGDCLVLFSAVCWSFYILRASRFGIRYDTIHLQGVKNFLLAILYTIWWWVDCNHNNHHHHGLSTAWKNPIVISILLYSALFPGTIADVLQQNAQGYVPATESTVLLSTEPIFTAILGFVLLGEHLTWQESVGGTFLMLGTFLASF